MTSITPHKKYHISYDNGDSEEFELLTPDADVLLFASFSKTSTCSHFEAQPGIRYSSRLSQGKTILSIGFILQPCI